MKNERMKRMEKVASSYFEILQPNNNIQCTQHFYTQFSNIFENHISAAICITDDNTYQNSRFEKYCHH